jgi:CRISPR type III-A-associated RAMP protein Csm5
MKFVLRVESPLHIGSGATLSWLDWRLEGRRYGVVDWAKLLDAVGEGSIDAFAAFTDRGAKLVADAAEASQKALPRERSDILRRVRDETDPARFARDELKDDALARRIRDGEFDRRFAEFQGGRLDRRLEVREAALDGAGIPTIPATSLRGQIRSALLHVALASSSPEVARRVLEGEGGSGWQRALADATPGRARFLFGETLEHAALRPANRMSDPRFDLMRFLRISEATRARPRLALVRLAPFVIQGTQIKPLAPLVVEALDVGSELEFEIRADAALLKGVAAAKGGTHAMVSDEFFECLGRVFGIAREEAAAMEVDRLEERMISAVEVALASRFAAQAARERQWFDAVGAPKDAALRAFVDGMAAFEERIPLRLGLGAGFHSVTAVLALDSDPLLAAPLGQALARAGIGLDPRARRDRAEREKQVIERDRREAGAKGEALTTERRDPRRVPVTRTFTMEGPLPDLHLGCASLARGELGAEAIDVTTMLASRVRAMRAPAPEAPEREPRRAPARRDDRGPRRDDRGPPRRDDRDDRGPRRDDRGPPRRDDRGPPRKPLPDRPATDDEIKKLLDRFGKR